ncbi:alpha/beta hydrolase [Planctomicrobium sp. SH661]|uniref:alpha/beta hydrolase n=1 Tax=Planctomicrobium sp. SH661 TaxID=3448124 RepID=UPI003F5B50FD
MSLARPLDSAVQKWLTPGSPSKNGGERLAAETSSRPRVPPLPAELKSLIEDEERIIPGGPAGHTRMQLFRPSGVTQRLPVILYIPGPGPGLGTGNSQVRRQFIGELSTQSHAAVVVINSQLPSDASVSTRMEESEIALKWIAQNGRQHGLDPARLTVAGDGCGANLAAALTLQTRQRSGPDIHRQILFFPATEVATQTQPSPEFPPVPALIITAEADHSPNEAAALVVSRGMTGAPITHIRFAGTLQQFMAGNAPSQTPAAREGLNLALAWLRQEFPSSAPGSR